MKESDKSGEERENMERKNEFEIGDLKREKSWIPASAGMTIGGGNDK